MQNNYARQYQPVPAYALKDISCVNCGKLGHMTCSLNSSDKVEEVDWGITEAIERGFYSFISNYDSWQEFRIKREKSRQPVADSNSNRLGLDTDKPPATESKNQGTKMVPNNNFKKLMLLDMD